MLSLAANGYPEALVRDVLHAKYGARHISFRYELLGKSNAYKRALEVAEGEISVNMGDETQRTGRFTFRDADDIDWQNDRIKPWYRLRMPDGGFAEYPQGVFYMPTHPRSRKHGRYYVDVAAYDLSYALQQDGFTNRYTVRRGTPYIAAVGSILNSAGVRTFLSDDSPEVLPTDRDWELGTSKAQIIADLLAAINYRPLTVTADGAFAAWRYVLPETRETGYTYRADNSSVIDPGGTLSFDTFGVPNVFVGVVSGAEMDGMRYAYEIDNPSNPFAARNRDGRRVISILHYDDIASRDVLEAAVHRAAYESMQVYETTSFTTAVMPHHEVGDILALDHDAANGRYEETSWSMPLTANGIMRHEARRLVYL